MFTEYLSGQVNKVNTMEKEKTPNLPSDESDWSKWSGVRPLDSNIHLCKPEV